MSKKYLVIQTAEALEEAASVLDAIVVSGTTLPANWRDPLRDELAGLAGILREAVQERPAATPTHPGIGTIYTHVQGDQGNTLVKGSRSSPTPREDYTLMWTALEYSDAAGRGLLFTERKLGNLLIRPAQVAHQNSMTPAEARQRYEQAAKDLQAAMVRTYPVGTVMTVELGGHLVTGRVASHANTWWYQPDRVHMHNLKTDKVRSFGLYEIELTAKRMAKEAQHG